ncbi:PREDICTED: vegetative cell wall protein gp1-like, partial [Priapulus caudatus]|uniref:Vegetative cell wall protein gp1-like n=1 Tax=Priapulus caudatus TaxID=37621 RepID=A0ABM1F2T8_PRICU
MVVQKVKHELNANIGAEYYKISYKVEVAQSWPCWTWKLDEPPTYAEVILEDLRMHQTYRSDDIMSHQGPPPKPAPAPKPSGLATKHPVNLLDDDLPVGDLLTYEFGPTLPPPLLPLPPSGALPSSRDPFDVAPVTSGPSRPLPTLPSHTAYAGAPSVTATAYAGAPSVTARQKPTLPQKPVGHAAAQQVAPPVPAARHNCWVSFDGQEQPPVLPRRQSLSQDRLSAASATVAPPRSVTHGSLEQLAAPTAAVRKTSLTEGRKKVAPRPPPPTTKQKPTVLRPTKPRTTGKPPAARGSLSAKSSSVKTNAPPPRPPSTYLSSQSFNRRGSTRSAGTASSSSSSFNPPHGVQPHTAGRSKQNTALDWGTQTTSASNLPPRPGPGHPLYHYTVTGPHGIIVVIC